MLKTAIIKKLPDGKYRLYSKEKDEAGNRRNLGTYDSRSGAEEKKQEAYNSDDGASDDKSTKAISKLSDIAGYLEEAGFIDASQLVYDSMGAIDGSFESAGQPPDNQMALPGSMDYMQTGGIFSIPEAMVMSSVANKLDKIGLYEEADELDEILEEMANMDGIIEKLEENEEKKPKSNKKPERDGKDVLVGANGLMSTTVQQHSGFSGLSDAYFYSSISDNMNNR